jgi:hypothetical protein
MAERPGSTAWFTLGGTVAGLGGVVMAIGFFEAAKPVDIWGNVWFRAGFAGFLLGLLAVAWGLYLFVKEQVSSRREQAEVPSSPDARRVWSGILARRDTQAWLIGVADRSR